MKSRSRLGFAAAVMLAAVGWAAPARAQQVNPVYTDDSPVARETLGRIAEFIGAGNDPEAVRELQRLLEEHPDRVVPVRGDPDLFVSVRDEVHRTLAAEPRILERYRAAETGRARQLLDAGEFEAVERSRLLTAPGLEAALRLAQVRLESGSFEAARLALVQLEPHPDRKGSAEPAQSAAAMLAQVAAYVDRPEVWETAQRWAREAGLPEPERRASAVPPALALRVATFTSVAPAVEPEGVPAKPLWSVPLAPEQLPGDLSLIAPMMEDQNLGQGALWVLPTVVGDTVYINDGAFITARDRFTLQPRWAIRPVSDFVGEDPYAARYPARPVEDTSTATVAGGLLIATMGAAENGEREGEPGTFAVDAATGQVRWAAILSRLDPQLEGASVRGPAHIDGDTVILSARKMSQGRRMITYYLIGLSAADGSLRWLRPVASAGSMVWGSRGDQRFSGAMVQAGILYGIDNLGVAAAIEAGSGRPLWVRRMPVTSITPGMPGESLMPWQWSPPIPGREGSLLVLAPDRSGLLELDAANGAITARRASSALGDPTYLVRIGSRFAAVGKDSIVVGDVDAIENGALRRSMPLAPAIRGRAVISGDQILVPTYEGVAIIDPANPGEPAGSIRLDQLGNVLPLESQLLAIDAQHLHSYLTWTVAHRLLDERMRTNPDDPEPAITYVELAYRASRHDQIAAAADKALAAIEKNPGSAETRLSRRRLFSVLKDMVDATQLGWEASHQAAQAIPAAEQPAAPARPAPDQPRLELPHLALVIQRMGRAALTSDDNVSYFFALGSLREAETKPSLAAEAYQHILSSSVLSTAVWRGRDASVRSELEATRRLRQILLEYGPAAYAPFESQAAAELGALGAGAGAAELEALARKFPASTAAATAWARAADLHEGAGRFRASIADLREGLAVAETASSAGIAPDSSVLSEIAGRLLMRLQRTEQYFAASQVLSRLSTQYPQLALTDHGTTLDPAALAVDLGAKLASTERFPAIGPVIKGSVQDILGWSLMAAPSAERTGAASEHAMMIAPGELKIALWALAGSREGGQAPSGGTQLQQVWSRSYQGLPPMLLRQDPDAIYLLWRRSSGGQGAILERINAIDGSTAFRTEPFRSLFPADANLQRRMDLLRNTIDVPSDGAVRLTDVIVNFDSRVIVMAERSGRIAAFDRTSGRMLWNITSPVSQVYDLDVGAGVLAIGGDAAPEADPHAIAGLSPLIALYDLATGRLQHRFDELAGQVRWLRMGAGPNQQTALIAGLMPEVVSLDLSGKVNWTVTGGPAFSSMDAWVFGDRIFLMDNQRELWLLDAARGRAPENPLPTVGRLSGGGAIEGTRIDQGRFAFASSQGLCIFDRTGRLIGLDALLDDTGEMSFLTPAPAQRHFVAMERTPRQGADLRVHYTIHILDNESAMLRSSRHVQLELPPKRIALLDGRIVVTAGNTTLVYEAPIADEPRRR